MIVIYRNKDEKASNANYSFVASSLCAVGEYKDMNNFSEEEFIKYCKPHNIFAEVQLKTILSK